ncbi:MAG: hypothetical protein ACYC9J_15235 [Sulfuricaulis sp.]
MNKISIKGVLVGNITTLLAGTIVVALLFILLGFMVVPPDIAHMTNEQAKAAVAAAAEKSPWSKAIPWIAGISCSILGGYVAAWLAKHNELLNGLLSSLIAVAVGGYLLIVGTDANQLLGLLGVISNPAGGLLGGYLILVMRRKHSISG